MASVEPFKVNSSGPSELLKAVAGIAEGIGKAVSASRERTAKTGSLRNQAAMHESQMVHEASQSQLAHERNLELIDSTHAAGKSIDLQKQELKERDREHIHEAATKFVTKEGTAVRGGSRVDIQETAEGGHRISFTAAAAKKKPAAAKAVAPGAPVASTPKSRSSAKTEVIKITNGAPGDQYND